MSKVIYLCKVREYKDGEYEKIAYSLLNDENPEKYYKKTVKKVKEMDPDFCLELLDYKSKKYNVIPVYIRISSKIRKLRNTIEKKEYKYDFKFDKSKFSFYELFKLDEFLVSIDEYNENNLKIDINEFIDSNDDIIVYKIAKGCYLCKYYFYSDNIKYSEILDKIKEDFKYYFDKNKIKAFEKEKEVTNIHKAKKITKFIVESKSLGKLDCAWLKTRLGIDFDSSKINDEVFVKELKEFYKGKENYFKSSYVETTEVQLQSYDEDYWGHWDEILLMSDEDLDKYKNHMTKIYEKFGYGCIEEFEYLDDYVEEPTGDEKIYRKIYDDSYNLVFEEIIYVREIMPFKPWYKFVLNWKED